MPTSIVEAVAFHHMPARSDLRAFGPLAAVHAANVLDLELSKAKSGGRLAELDAGYLGAVSVQNRVETWRAEAVKALAAPEEN